MSQPSTLRRPTSHHQPSLTIALPVHNGESRLRGCVLELLDLASELTSQFSVLIIDDGSTDDTLDVAEELAARFPQVSVRRHRHRRGLGASIDFIERRVRTDVVIVHDGVTPIEPDQVRRLWKQSVVGGQSSEVGDKNSDPRPSTSDLSPPTSDFQPLTPYADLRELANLPSLHASLARAHQRVLGFQLLTPSHRDEAADIAAVGLTTPHGDSTHRRDRVGVGQVPSLPRPKFLAALREFAFGE